jgi:peptide/nickel transport system substrate-binding protein
MDRKVASLVCIFILFLSFTIGMVSVKRQVDVAGSRNSEVATVQEANEATPKYGGTLRAALSLNANPIALNPLINEGKPQSTNYYNLWVNILNSLARLDRNGTLTPDLAFAWVTTADGLNCTFYLYENITWHDGTEFNAYDVKFTFDTILENPDAADYWKTWAGGGEVPISQIEVTGPYAITFVFDQYYAPGLGFIACMPIIPRHLYEGTDILTNPYNTAPVGTGPFRFVEFNPDANLTLEANPLYFRGRPYLDTLFLRWDLSLEGLTDSLLNNEIDIIPEIADPYRIEELAEIPGVSYSASIRNEVTILGLNLSNSYLGNLDVRQALTVAVNKSDIVWESFLGYAEPAFGPFSPDFGYWYNQDITKYGYNKTKAQELLDQAGYPIDNETGVRFSLTLRVGDWNLYRVNATRIVAEYWQAIGVNATVQVCSTFQEMCENFSIYAVTYVWLEAGGDPSVIGPVWGSTGSQNFWNYCNSQLDDLIAQGLSEANQTRRKEIYDQAQEILAVEVPSLFLYQQEQLTIFNNDFHGFASGGLVSQLYPYSLEKAWYDRTLSGEGNCPYRVCFTDSEGRRTGYYDGAAYEDIPESTYSGIDSDPQVVKIREPAGIYAVELFGTENASYKFEFTNIALYYKNVRIPEGYIHENETITYLVKIFEDGSMKVYDYDDYSEHDVGVRSMTSSKTVVCQDYKVNLSVSVFDWGSFTENFNATVYANTTAIATFTDITLTSGNSTTLDFTWNTSGFAKGNYTISAYLTPVPGETDTNDNRFVDGEVMISKLGDLNLDGAVNYKDASLFRQAYIGEYSYLADFNQDEVINYKDASLFRTYYVTG